MFGIGFGELILILAAALIIIGPDRLPAMAKTLARALNEFKKAGDEIKTAITDSSPFSDSGQKSYAAKGAPAAAFDSGVETAGGGAVDGSVLKKDAEGGEPPKS